VAFGEHFARGRMPKKCTIQEGEENKEDVDKNEEEEEDNVHINKD
jgi:hypothetical protein